MTSNKQVSGGVYQFKKDSINLHTGESIQTIFNKKKNNQDLEIDFLQKNKNETSQGY